MNKRLARIREIAHHLSEPFEEETEIDPVAICYWVYVLSIMGIVALGVLS